MILAEGRRGGRHGMLNRFMRVARGGRRETQGSDVYTCVSIVFVCVVVEVCASACFFLHYPCPKMLIKCHPPGVRPCSNSSRLFLSLHSLPLLPYAQKAPLCPAHPVGPPSYLQSSPNRGQNVPVCVIPKPHFYTAFDAPALNPDSRSSSSSTSSPSCPRYQAATLAPRSPSFPSPSPHPRLAAHRRQQQEPPQHQSAAADETASYTLVPVSWASVVAAVRRPTMS